MKKLVTLFVLILGLMPLAASADIAAVAVPLKLNFTQAPLFGSISSGQCLQTGSQGEVQGSGSACGSGGGGSSQRILINLGAQINFYINQSTIQVLGPANGAIPVTADMLQGQTVKNLTIDCLPFNSSDPHSYYLSNTQHPDVGGITGGTITFYDYPAGSTAPVAIGTVTLPDSPPGGPYVTSATLTLSSPYAMLGAEDTFGWTQTSSSTSTNAPALSCGLVIGT